jgi:hypothetical protein
MTRHGTQTQNTFRLNLNSPEDREQLRTILSGITPGTPLTMTVGASGTAGGSGTTARSAPRGMGPLATPGYADAMRQVEATYYDTV